MHIHGNYYIVFGWFWRVSVCMCANGDDFQIAKPVFRINARLCVHPSCCGDCWWLSAYISTPVTTMKSCIQESQSPVALYMCLFLSKEPMKNYWLDLWCSHPKMLLQKNLGWRPWNLDAPGFCPVADEVVPDHGHVHCRRISLCLCGAAESARSHHGSCEKNTAGGRCWFESFDALGRWLHHTILIYYFNPF